MNKLVKNQHHTLPIPFMILLVTTSFAYADGTVYSQDNLNGYTRLEQELSEEEQQTQVNKNTSSGLASGTRIQSRYSTVEDSRENPALTTLYRQQTELKTLARDFAELEKASLRLEELLREVEAEQEKIRTRSSTESSMQEIESEAMEESQTPLNKIKAFDIPLTQIENDVRAQRVKHEELLFVDKRIGIEMPIAIINAPAAPLFAGPNPELRVLYRAHKGEIVAIEQRYEDWYRIIHESGMRGWVLADDLLFGADSRSLPGKIIRIKAYDIASDRSDWEPAQ
ncbi:MAG: SH3 domain-containing protein [Bdellovibrionota bacterium]